MTRRFSSQIALATPLLASTGLIVAITVAVNRDVGSLASSFRSHDALVATLGDGIDVFTAQILPLVASIGDWAYQARSTLLACAALATALVAITARAQLRGRVHGMRDFVALARRGTSHFTSIFRPRASMPAIWGSVLRVDTCEPIACASVHLVDSVGRVLESALTGSRGRYGFRVTLTDAAQQGMHVSLQVQKDGHYFSSKRVSLQAREYRGGIIPVLAGLYDARLDIPLVAHIDLRRSKPSHRTHHVVARLGMAIGLVTVPLALVVAPSALSMLIATTFGASAIVHGMGHYLEIA